MNVLHDRAKSIFLDAVEIASIEERRVFVDAKCAGDDALRADVEDYLKHHEGLGSFLQAVPPGQPSEFATVVPRTQEGPGTMIGPYKLLEQIGEGGFGLVFMAEQQQPVRRKVAVKILKPGMDSRQVIARFEAERQALALMDHAHIAHVLDAGETASGRPYFAMELVRGIPITDFCDKNKLPPRERLELFLTVCQAVQHAHHKGIIHRDLKPSNVLVTLHDGAPVVKVIDFGIAKALGQQLTDKTLYTGFAQMIGTPLYMSPEQAEMSGLDIDTRSDIYSLGVLLYELLTGTTPFDKGRLAKAGYDEMRRIIREEEPARPSRRFSTKGDAATVVSAQRKSDPKRLSQMFRGELDWIVMKALEKERGRRYETASAFAADVSHYLRDERVSACPPSTWYRFGKFARRHKVGLISSALIALALVAGTGVSLWQAILATEAANSERQALTELGKEQRATKQALLDLGEEQLATRRELDRTQEAEKKATLELFESLVAQARANRLSRRVGQRFQTLELLRKATGIARQLKVPAERFLEMRNEAIAALALPDLRRVSEMPDGGAYSVYFDANIERYAHTDRQGNVQIRRAEDGKVIFRLASVGAGEPTPMLSPDGNYLSVWGVGRVQVWHLAGVDQPKVLNVPALGQPNFSPDSRRLAVQEADGSISLYDLATRKRTQQLPKLPRVYFLAFHPGGERLALACHAFVEVRDLQSGAVVWHKDLPGYSYRVAQWHPGGKTLAVGDGQTIALWDVANDQQVAALEVNSAAGTNFAFNPAGNLLASNSWEGVLRLWDPLTGRLLFSNHIWMKTPFPQFSADGRFLAATHQDQKLQTWEIAAADEYRTLIASPMKGKRPYGCVAISPDARFLAAGTGGAFAAWDLSTGKELAFQEGSPFNFVAFERGPQKQEAVLVRSAANGVFRSPIRAAPLSGAIDFGPIQKLPVPVSNSTMVQSEDGRLRVFSQKYLGSLVQDTEQPDKLIKLEPPHQDVRHIAISPDGRWIATGRFSYPGGIKIWELGRSPTKELTYKFVKDLACFGTPLPVFSPDGKYLLATAVAGISPARRWEVGTWTANPFKEPIEGSNTTFSHDGKLLILETGSGVASLLDADTSKPYARLEDPDQHRTACFALTPAGTKLVCASTDGCCIHIWDLRTIRRQLTDMGLNWE